LQAASSICSSSSHWVLLIGWGSLPFDSTFITSKVGFCSPSPPTDFFLYKLAFGWIILSDFSSGWNLVKADFSSVGCRPVGVFSLCKLDPWFIVNATVLSTFLKPLAHSFVDPLVLPRLKVLLLLPTILICFKSSAAVSRLSLLLPPSSMTFTYLFLLQIELEFG